MQVCLQCTVSLAWCFIELSFLQVTYDDDDDDDDDIDWEMSSDSSSSESDGGEGPGTTVYTAAMFLKK